MFSLSNLVHKFVPDECRDLDPGDRVTFRFRPPSAGELEAFREIATGVEGDGSSTDAAVHLVSRCLLGVDNLSLDGVLPFDLPADMDKRDGFLRDVRIPAPWFHGLAGAVVSLAVVTKEEE